MRFASKADAKSRHFTSVVRTSRTRLLLHALSRLHLSCDHRTANIIVILAVVSIVLFRDARTLCCTLNERPATRGHNEGLITNKSGRNGWMARVESDSG